MNRAIFVGSSHEGLPEAELVCAALKAGDSAVEPKLWTSFFEASSLTFEALEEMLQDCCAAVFVVRPDDFVRHIEGDNHKAKHMPRANVLLEFGLVAGRLGRRNIAVCRFGEADLPTDLSSMTVVDMDREHGWSPPIAKDAEPPKEVVEKLRRWTARLMATADGIPRTVGFHGYTGRWEFEVQLSQWRGLRIQDYSYAVLTGTLDLLICAEGLAGIGYAYGVLAFRLDPSASQSVPTRQPYIGDIQLTHEVRNVDCNVDGSIQFTSRMLQMHLLHSIGERWPELPISEPIFEPWIFKWTLSPNKCARELEGTVETSASGGTKGVALVKKHQSTY